MASSGISILRPAPPAQGSGGGGEGRWAWLVTAGGLVEAELIRGALEAAGLPVALDRRDPSPFAWMYLSGNPNAPVGVFVPAGLLDPARLALLEAGVAISDERAGPGSAADVPGGVRRAVRMLVMVAAAAACLFVLVVTFLGSATCALRLFC